MEKKKERRKLQRFSLEIPARVEVISGEKQKGTIEVLTSDICAGGAYFKTPRPLPEGTQVKIDMVLPLEHLRKLSEEYNRAYIKVSGTVLRTESSGMAVSFDEDYELGPYKEDPGKAS
ncbi:MAG: PilZ domain-containing protein [Deltaproteobacteria bacterium]|nr:MAG: PilZ domain-containing protein [Deltaproteobacteria bacterium]